MLLVENNWLLTDDYLFLLTLSGKAQVTASVYRHLPSPESTTVTPRITMFSGHLLCTRPSTPAQLLSHTMMLGAKEEHPILQLKKLRLLLPRSQRKEDRARIQPRSGSAKSALFPGTLVTQLLWGHTQQPPASGVAFPAACPAPFRVGPKEAVYLSETKARRLGRPWRSQIGSAGRTHCKHLSGSQ